MMLGIRYANVADKKVEQTNTCESCSKSYEQKYRKSDIYITYIFWVKFCIYFLVTIFINSGFTVAVSDSNEQGSALCAQWVVSQLPSCMLHLLSLLAKIMARVCANRVSVILCNFANLLGRKKGAL